MVKPFKTYGHPQRTTIFWEVDAGFVMAGPGF
jgi:hypothetical protein